ncbi:unnamed protein product [Oikopleura dioica]|uniref:Connexin N-terminal domain-containing protein n=1 Tax=Oikopleura dioica TaxID=34765 RepID=E4WRV0_OIKDI|nr:unnamed protein product [Oikopleura dioica]
MNDIKSKVSQSNQFNSIFGQIWNYTNFIARLLPIGLTKDLFSDEIVNFVSPLTANTGVRNYCFNKFQPINFHRFFTMQLLAIMVPRLIYYGYAMQLTAKLKAKKNDENYTRPIKERVIRNNNKAEIIPYSSSMIIANIISGICSIIIEMVFLYLLFKILDIQHDFSTNMSFFDKLKPPSEYYCTINDNELGDIQDRNPLGGRSARFTIPRSYEKRFVFTYLSVMTIVSIVFLVLDLITISLKEFTRKNRSALNNVLRPTG